MRIWTSSAAHGAARPPPLTVPVSDEGAQHSMDPSTRLDILWRPVATVIDTPPRSTKLIRKYIPLTSPNPLK